MGVIKLNIQNNITIVFCCKRKTHISRIKVLQNDYFTKTIVSKKACEICYRKAKELLERAKPQLRDTFWYRNK